MCRPLVEQPQQQHEGPTLGGRSHVDPRWLERAAQTTSKVNPTGEVRKTCLDLQPVSPGMVGDVGGGPHMFGGRW